MRGIHTHLGVDLDRHLPQRDAPPLRDLLRVEEQLVQRHLQRRQVHGPARCRCLFGQSIRAGPARVFHKTHPSNKPTSPHLSWPSASEGSSASASRPLMVRRVLMTGCRWLGATGIA